MYVNGIVAIGQASDALKSLFRMRNEKWKGDHESFLLLQETAEDAFKRGDFALADLLARNYLMILDDSEAAYNSTININMNAKVL